MPDPLVTPLLVASLAAGTASTALSLFNKPKIPKLPETPTKSSAEIQAESAKERLRRSRAQGRSSTLVASLGQGGQPSGQTELKTKLGQ